MDNPNEVAFMVPMHSQFLSYSNKFPLGLNKIIPINSCFIAVDTSDPILSIENPIIYNEVEFVFKSMIGCNFEDDNNSLFRM